MSVFFDSNVLVYALDVKQGLKHARADTLLGEHMLAGTLYLSTQVMQETYSVLTRKKGIAAEAALTALGAFPADRVVGTSADSVLRALAFGLRHRLSVWDALIVQAALDARCSTLLTEDLRAGLRFGDLEIVNPFLPGVQEPTPISASSGSARTQRRRPRPL